MNENIELAIELSARLPELLWRMNKLKVNVGLKRLPEGLFSKAYDRTPACCINEIKADLKVLKQQLNPKAAQFIAGKVSRKINVLVRLCQLQGNKKWVENPEKFSIQAIHTRQQWLHTLEYDIRSLTTQHEALKKRLDGSEHTRDTQKMLTLQSDLGEIERQLTLAKEAWSKAMS